MAKYWVEGHTRKDGVKVKGHWRNKSENSDGLISNYKETYQGKEYTYRVGKNQYGQKVATRYADGVKTNYSTPVKKLIENIRGNKKNAKK